MSISSTQWPCCHTQLPHDATSRLLEAALEGQAHGLPGQAEGPHQQGAGAHVRLNFLFLPGDASDSLSQTTPVTGGQGQRQL